MAGFEVTINGRFWVTTEAQYNRDYPERLEAA
jgi:hypothetical protein